MLTRRLFFSLIPAVLLTAGAVLWLLPGAAERGSNEAETTSPLDAEFDYFISAMQRASFTANGQPTHTLEAARVVHYPTDDRAELERPDLVWYQPNAAPWMLSANAGTLRGAGTEAEDLLDLRDDVVLRRPLEDGSMLTMRTSQLDAVLATREFSTEQPVMLDSVNMHTDSTGMRGNLRDNYVELLHDVRGRHAPIPRQP